MSRHLLMASAVLAILAALFLGFQSWEVAMEQMPPPGFSGFWDPPKPPPLIEIVLIAALFAGGVFSLWRGWVWLLLAAWTLSVGVTGADSVIMAIPSLRASYRFPPAHGIAGELAAFVFNVPLMFSLICFGLAVPALLRSKHKMAKTGASTSE